MRDRRIILAKVFSLSILTFQLIFLLSTLPNLLSTPDIVGVLMQLGFLLIMAFVVFVFPNLYKVILSVPYHWSVLVMTVISILMILFAITRFPLIIHWQSHRLSDYTVVIGGGLFALTNVITILMTLGASDSGN
jgi:hypothetical protein